MQYSKYTCELLDTLHVDVSQCPYIPVLDDPFVEHEMQEAIQEIKANKAPNLNGISPGLPKLLPADWILRMTIFNLIFLNAVLPASWTLSKLFVIFKKGLSILCGNYRGMNDSIFEIFDRMWLNRLKLMVPPITRASRMPGEQELSRSYCGSASFMRLR